MDDRTCSFPECTKAYLARGWCSQHYQRWQKYGTPFVQEQIQGDDWTRFWSKVSGDTALRCWAWLGGLDKDGYGLVRMGKSTKRAHRASWELMRGEIPDDPTTGRALDLDHECRNRVCVNPWHLDPVTPQVNTRRAQWWLDQGFFRCGHLRSGPNIRPMANGCTYCLTCSRSRATVRRALKQGVVLDYETVAASYFLEIMTDDAAA